MLLFNLILMLVVYHVVGMYGANILDFSYSVISWFCTIRTWVTAEHAAAIVVSLIFSSIAAIVFPIFGRFSLDELRGERQGGNVLAACFLTVVMMLFFIMFWLPCGEIQKEVVSLSKVRFGALLVGYLRENYLLFFLLLSVLNAGFFYALALAIKIISFRR